MLMKSGLILILQILTCGLNTYHQLGISPPPANVNKPRPVRIDLQGDFVFGIAASTFHSVVWTSTSLYTCGLHAGELGHEKSTDVTIPYFKKVSHLSFEFA